MKLAREYFLAQKYRSLLYTTHFSEFASSAFHKLRAFLKVFVQVSVVAPFDFGPLALKKLNGDWALALNVVVLALPQTAFHSSRQSHR